MDKWDDLVTLKQDLKEMNHTVGEKHYDIPDKLSFCIKVLADKLNIDSSQHMENNHQLTQTIE